MSGHWKMLHVVGGSPPYISEDDYELMAEELVEELEALDARLEALDAQRAHAAVLSALPPGGSVLSMFGCEDDGIVCWVLGTVGEA